MKFIFLIANLFVANLYAVTADEILQRADDIRNPSESFVMKVLISGSNKGDVREFEISIKGDDKTYAKVLAPPRDFRRDMLMIEENMWVFVPKTLNKSIRVSLSQKLTGQAANGDICRTRWRGDYTSIIESETSDQWILLLTAKRKGLTYEKIRATIEKKSFRPLKANYLGVSGTELKNATFSEYQPIAGATRPTLIVIKDASNASNFSEIRIQSMIAKKIPDTLFTLEHLEGR